VRVFKTKHFSRWASGELLGDNALCVAAKEAFAGQVEADLGGYLFKKRIKRAGSGKSSSYRTILGFRKANDGRIFFLFGFAKNERSTITVREQTALSVDAAALVVLRDEQIEALLRRAAIFELECTDE
jgi:hypothetical protein